MKNIFQVLGIIAAFLFYYIFPLNAPSIESQILEREEEEHQALVDLHESEKYYEELAMQGDIIAATPVYFINNGFYFHKNATCKGLQGYEYNETTIDDLINYPSLDPCNWCAK